MKALIFTRKFKEPSGEGIYSRNIVDALFRIYDDAHLFTFEAPQIATLKRFSGYNSPTNNRLDVHFVGCPLLSRHALPLLGALAKPRSMRFYAYNFGLMTGNDPFGAVKNLLGVSMSNLTKGVSFLTTSLKSYTRLSYLNPLNTHYVPAPVRIPRKIKRKTKSDQFNLLYLGQAYYIRFPYDRILRSIGLMHKMEIPLKLFVRFSTRHTDERLIKNARHLVNKLNLGGLVDMELRDLPKKVKELFLSKADALLYPAIRPSATDPPTVVLEAMARGTCAISTPLNSLPITMGKEAISFIDESDIPSSMASWVKRLALNSALREAKARLARKSVEERHSLNAFSNRISQIVETR